MTLPILVSVPHAGLRVPESVAPLVQVSHDDIVRDGDEQAAEVYSALESRARHFVTTDVARAILDMNRPENDRRKDGVVKTHTCWDVPVYREFPSEEAIEHLLATYHRPYHATLTRLARRDVVIGVDCHTMAATGPPVGPDPGATRPVACVSNGDETCPDEWAAALAHCLERTLGGAVPVNSPFRGGHITRTHAAEMPWVQLELSRGDFMTAASKRDAVLDALEEWHTTITD